MTTATFKTIRKSIDINAPKEKVWQVLIEDNFTRQWYKEFSPGSYAETDWSVGSTAKFFDGKQDGLIARIVTNKRAEELSMTFIGMSDKGKEIFDGPFVDDFKGKFETYKLREHDGVTTLDISTEMSEDYYDEMDKAWDSALQIVKNLAEGI